MDVAQDDTKDNTPPTRTNQEETAAVIGATLTRASVAIYIYPFKAV